MGKYNDDKSVSDSETVSSSEDDEETVNIFAVVMNSNPSVDSLI
jgi:hypothetical protein